MYGYRWLNKTSQQFLESDYLEPGQTVDQRVDLIGQTAERLLSKPGYAKQFKRYMKKGWYSLSTPIWTNFGNDRGLPISCFGSHIEDDSASILFTQAEVSMMSKCGGGTSAYFGKLRGRGSPIKGGRNGKSGGPLHFLETFDKNICVWSQGATRRGSFAAYLPIDHPDILEFLAIKSEGNPIQDISYGVCIKDAWLEDMIAGDKQKRGIWAKVLESRNNRGYPYLFFTDNVNNGTVDVYRDKGLRINHSNLCSEILLPSTSMWSFVCDLSSINILYYDEWKDTDAVEILVYLLEAVMTEFITKAKPILFMHKAVQFAEDNRALGLGWIGWHSYLQSRMIPFESMEAKLLNTQIAKNIYDKAYAASAKMAKQYGEPPILKGYGRRHTTLLAIAPTTSSSFILGQVSKAIEPYQNNYFIPDLAKGKFDTFQNPYLLKLLDEKGLNTDEVWRDILMHGGSVQHLDSLDEDEKGVFKTFQEISQKEIVLQAASRQRYIDQGQSLNIMIDPHVPVKDVNTLILDGWRDGIKSFYYQHNVNAAQQLGVDILRCVSCES